MSKKMSAKTAYEQMLAANLKARVPGEFDTETVEQYLMQSGQLHVGFNMPEALVGDQVHSLPPYRRRKSFLVDEYPACPENWPRSQGSLTSFFVPVVEGKGMWLDFNDLSTPYELAIVVSVQGVNAVTGMPVEDVYLEQYREECPKHKVKFGPHRFCEKCGYRWPKQNYVSSAGTPSGSLWLDGFRAADGIVRQYILTAEKIRGVAKHIVGERRVYAIGLSFFLSKEKCRLRDRSPLRVGGGTTVMDWGGGPVYGKGLDMGDNEQICYFSSTGDTSTDSIGGSLGSEGTFSKGATKGSHSLYKMATVSCAAPAASASAAPTKGGGHSKWATKGLMKAKSFISDGVKSVQSQMPAADDDIQYASERTFERGITNPVQVKNLEVGAGEKIDQCVFDDPNDLDFYRKDPEAVIVINYCPEEDARKIIAAGKKDIVGSKEGFLQSIPTGNKVAEQKA